MQLIILSHINVLINTSVLWIY